MSQGLLVSDCPKVFSFSDAAKYTGSLCSYNNANAEPWYSCFSAETRGASYTCGVGWFCPGRKPRGVQKCCPYELGTLCTSGFCIREGRICCGNGGCDSGQECNSIANSGAGGCCAYGRTCGTGCFRDGYSCCGGKECSNGSTCLNNSQCCANVCGGRCLDGTGYKCCGTTTCYSSQTCIGGGCCSNVCGSKCLDGTSQTCCGGSASGTTCSSSQTCMSGKCCSNVCGNQCLDGTQQKCCGGDLCSSSQTCLSNSCCGNVCGSQCLDGTGQTCCGGTVCSSSQSCINQRCVNPSSSLARVTTSPARVTTSSARVTTSSSRATSAPAAKSPDPNAISNEPSPAVKADVPDPTGFVATAIPENGKGAEAACFLATQYASYYTTPSWYATLPANAQSVYSASHTDLSSSICTSTAVINREAGGGGGLSKGAQIGIGVGVGVPLVAALAGLLMLLKLKPAIFGLAKGGAVATSGNGPIPSPGVGTDPMTSTTVGIDPMSSPFPSGGDPHYVGTKFYPVVVGAARQYQKKDEPVQNPYPSPRSNAIQRKPVASASEAEMGQSNSDGWREGESGTVSPYSDRPYSDLGSLSGHFGATEVGGMPRFEIDGGIQRHEADGNEMFEAPDGIRR